MCGVCLCKMESLCVLEKERESAAQPCCTFEAGNM